MTATYSLKFGQEVFPFQKEVQIYHSKKNGNGRTQYFVFLDEKLYSYDLENHEWNTNLLLDRTNKTRVLYFPKRLENEESLMLLKTKDGIHFYQYKDDNFHLLLRSEDFGIFFDDDFYEWDKPGNIIKCGHFYDDRSLIGILTKHEEEGLEFHFVNKALLMAGEYPLLEPEGIDFSMFGNITNSNFFLADLQDKGKENIIVRSRSGMDIYEFDQNDKPQHLLQVPSSKVNDTDGNLFFPRLTGQSLKDIVEFNANGLFVYQYDMKQKNYKFIHYNPLFDNHAGWDDKYVDTVRFRDINSDGRDEMFLTGPRGVDILSFDNYTLQWNSVLDVSQTAVSERHTNFLDIAPIDSLNSESSIVFTHDENNIRWAKIGRAEKQEIDDSEDEEFDEQPPNTSDVIPELIKIDIPDEEKPHILLRDQLDLSSILKGVDKDTGKATFELPLIGLPNFAEGEKMNFYYNGNSKEANILGVGWSFPVSFILLDNQGSIFEDHEMYYIFLEDFPQQLILDSESSTDDVQYFKLSEEQLPTQITYYKSEERWEIEYRGIKQIYGRRQNSVEDSNEHSVNLDLTWEFWRGLGSSSEGQIELPTTWFLSELRGGLTSATYYDYEMNNALVPQSNKKFTREIYLKTIHDLEGNKIVFNYAQKDLDEYNLPPLVDESGNFNPKKVLTRYLTGYSLTTSTYRQEVSFNYRVEQGKRILTEIVQDNDPINRPVLQFFYSKIMDSHELERVVLPTGVEVEFSYEVVGGDLEFMDNINLITKVSSSYRVDYGQDFVLISSLNSAYHVALRMLDRELKNDLYSTSSQEESTRFPFLGEFSVRAYEVKLLYNAIIFTLDYESGRAVCLLTREKNKWSLIPKYFNFAKDAIIKIGDDFVAALDATEPFVNVLFWDKKSKEWIMEKIEIPFIAASPDSLLQASGKVFFIYNDEDVILGYRSKKNEWDSKVILAVPGVIEKLKWTLSKFQLDSDSYKTVFNLMKSNAFQVSNNFIVFNEWDIRGTESHTFIKLYTLDSKYEIRHRHNHNIMQDDLDTFTDDIEVVDDDKRKTYFTLGYEKQGEQFRIVIKDIKGAMLYDMSEYCKFAQNFSKCYAEQKKEAINHGHEAVQKFFILNMQKYLVYLQSSVVICSGRHFMFDGNNWILDEKNLKKIESGEWNVPLDEFLLAQENLESSVKLFNRGRNGSQKGDLILDLQVKNFTYISNKFPTYLAYKRDNQVNLAFYELLNIPNVSKTFELPPGETVSLMSDHSTLVTHVDQDSGDDKSVFLYFRNFMGMKSKLPNPVIKKLTVNFDREYKRFIGYEYDPSTVKAAGDILFYEKTVMVPGNNRTSAGYIQESTSMMGNYDAINNIHDASGKLIKSIRAEPYNNNKTITEESNRLNSTILDVSGNLEVAQFSPYEMQTEEVGYYGFEDYEVNKIGGANSTNQNRWSFNESDIVKKEFSLTGENYLKLSKSRLLGVFQPCNQYQHYVASCWVRTTGKDLEIGQIATYLKATVYAQDNREINGYFSEVKFQNDNWSYLEVVIDLFYAREVFENLLLSSNSSSVVKYSKSIESGAATANINSSVKVEPFKIIVTVSPGINSTVDVDHIRFSPLNSNFKAITYNYKSKIFKEIINANGLIQRYFHDDFQNRIVSIKESGEIEKISISTKASSIGRMVGLKSKVEIRPIQGFYEDFNPYSFRKRWNVDNNQRWKIAPGELYHLTNQFDKLKLNNIRNHESSGMRLRYALQSETSTIRFNDDLQLERRGDNAIAVFLEKRRSIPTDGEILVVAENNRLMMWIDGGLYFDECGLDKSLFDLSFYGNTKISELLVFKDVSVRVNYLNALDETVQEIQLESANSVIVTESVYDELGRHSITTRPTRLQRSTNESILGYYSNFVTNKNPHSDNSIWKINQIQGEFESLDPYSYYQVTYGDNPLNEKSRIGFPGQDFSVSGFFAQRFSSTTENRHINKTYSTDLKYRHVVEHKLGNVEDVKVLNDKNNTVAWLVDAPGILTELATYEYNDDGKLMKTLSPLYHKKAKTLQQLEKDDKFSAEENNEELNSLIVETTYDEKGNVIAKRNPDSGKIEYLYNDSGLQKFTIFYSDHNDTVVENVVYFNYDQLGRLINTGKLISPPEKEKLLNLQLTKNNTEEYQAFYRSDFERDPTIRGRLKRTVTHNDGSSFIEELVLNGDKRVVSKRIVVQNEKSDDPLLITTNKRYKAGKLREIEYPVNVQGKPFKITYTYDKLGRITAIGIPSKNNLFVEFAYNSVGHIIAEHHLPDKLKSNFKRNYSYNSASYLTKLEDKFLTENVYYTEGSYGGYGYGHGLVTRTEFNATWHGFADTSKLSLNEKSFISLRANPRVSKLCFDGLKEAGYINQYNRQAKIYYPLLEVNLPYECIDGANARLIQKTLGQKGFPSTYGHLYDYGAYEELVRAKYFVGDDIPTILLPDTFANTIPKINVTASQDIWKILNKNHYLIGQGGLFSKQGKAASKSFIRSTLCGDLKSVKENYETYCHPMTKALLLFFSQKLDLSLFKKNLRNAIFKWAGEIIDINKIEKAAKAIIEMLENKGYLKNPLDGKFNELLQRYKSIVPEIVNVLFQHFGKQLGEAEFDLQAYEIDENGNHRDYRSASDSFKLKYRDNSNQIESLDFISIVSEIPTRSSFLVKHDHRGNVVQALHKGIKNITYHPVSNRATSIELQDGRKLIFNYDAQGERVLKRILDATGAVKKEVHYVRDEFGRSLVERELTWSSPNLPPSVLVTAYIYGPKGLIGFIRRDEYYSVITDHEGSIRLVVKDGEAVAAYDYLPYGNLMRQYGINSETHISYRYTGQEWDEELGLYNYHARLYDPTIGRFYQHDPKMQYFSPYKYAGNSPVSMIDPNGEEAITIIITIILAAVGIYLGGAAAGGSWNPLKWDFTRADVWIGMILGALTAFTPSSLLASVAAFTAMGVSYSAAIGLTVALGAAGVYLGMASGNNEWDPTKWDYSSTATWTGAFFGALTLAGAPGVINSSRLFYSSLSSIYSKGLFVITGLSTGVGFTALNLAGRKIDFTKPTVYFEVLNGLLLGFDVTLLVINAKGPLKLFIQRYRNFRIVPTNDIELLEHVNLNLGNADDALESLTRGGLLKEFANSAFEDGQLELDFALTFNFNSFINDKIADSNLISFGSLINKNQKIINDIVPRNTAVNKMKSIAKEIVDTYKRIIKDYEFPQESYTDNMRERLEAGIIPNTILAIAMTVDDMAFVAFSGNAGPGFLSPFFRKGDNLHIGYPPDSPKVPRKIAINDDDNINNLIEHVLEDKRNIMEEINYRTYLNEKDKLKSRFDEVITSLSSPKLKSYFNNVEVVNFVEKIGDEIKGNGYVQSKERINIIILTFLLQKHNMLKKITPFSKDLQKIESNQMNKLIELEEKIVQLEKSVGLAEHEIDPNQAFAEKKKMLISRLEALREMKDQIYSDVTALSEVLNEEVALVWKDYLRKYLNEFEHWSPTIFTEPQLVTLLMSDRIDFPIQVAAKYTLDDLEYLAPEKVMRKRYISENDQSSHCIDCKESTTNVTNIVIDPEWENMIATERTKLIDAQNVEGYCSKRFNFLKPYSEVKSEKMCPKTTKGKVDGIRKKRSAEDKRSIMTETDSSDNIISENYENKFDYIEDNVSDNDKNKKSTNFTDNLFGWMRTSVNKLFDSKKILPETVSNSHALKGINGSTNNLSSVTAFVDVNSTLLLLDTVIRKVTGQKYTSTSDDNATLLESRGYSLDIGMAFEKTMKYAASKSGISMHRFDIHYTEIQDKVIDKIMSGKLDEIAEILISHAEKACPTRETGCPGKLSPKKFEKFIDVFSKRIDTELNEIMMTNKKIKSM